MTEKAAEAEVLLEVLNLTKLFPLRTRWLGRRRFARALNAVSLVVRNAETLGVVGETGAGKTTLGRAVLRLVNADYGHIFFDDENITDLTEAELRPLRRRMQPIFQDPSSALDPDLSVAKIVSEGLLLNARFTTPSAAVLHEHASHWLSQVGLAQTLSERLPAELSAGERQRVAIARALAVSPRLLVCDEPLSALDVSARAQIVNLLLDLQERFGLSTLFISHDLHLVRYMSHRIAVMYAGRIVETARADDLYAQSQHPYTRALLSANRVGARRTSLRILIDGESPDASAVPKGCAFHPRCPRMQTGVCDELSPDLLALPDASEHWVACHFPCG